MTSLKTAVFARRETTEFIMPLLWPTNLPGLTRISATATVLAPKLLKMSFDLGFGFGQATATAETGDWFRPAAECV